MSMNFKPAGFEQASRNSGRPKAAGPFTAAPESHECPGSHQWPVLPVVPALHLCPKSPAPRVCPESPVSPVSNGESLDGAIEKKLKRIGADNACTEAESDKLWQLTRDLSAIEKGIGRELEIGELIPALEEWYRLSKQFLDPAQSRDDYLAELAGGLGKVRYATGEGDTLNKAFAAVSEFPASELPFVRQAPNAPESWRRVLALHRELSRGSKRKNKTYFLSYRDAAKAHNGLTHQTAYHITLVLRRVKAIEIVSKGKASPNGGKAAEFRYLLPDTSAAG